MRLAARVQHDLDVHNMDHPVKIQIAVRRQCAQRLIDHGQRDGRGGRYAEPSGSRPLPAHIQPGDTLRPEDVLELRILLTRRDTYLEFLYEREQDYSQQLEGRDWRIGTLQTRQQELRREIAANKEYLEAIDRSPSLRLGKAITRPARKLRSMAKGK
jgi:hypothetical protein